MFVGVPSAGTDLRPWSCLSLTGSPPGGWALSAPVPAPPKTPALPWTPALAGCCLTHPLLLPPGPLRGPALSLGGSAPTTAPGLTQMSPGSLVPEDPVPRGPTTHRLDACSSGDACPPLDSWEVVGMSCLLCEPGAVLDGLGQLRLYINKSLCPSVCHRVAVPAAGAGHGTGCSMSGPPCWLREWVWGQERMAELVKLPLCSRAGHGHPARRGQGLQHGSSAALLGCRGWGPRHAAAGRLDSIWESNCREVSGETPPAPGSVPRPGRAGGHQHPPDAALGLSAS